MPEKNKAKTSPERRAAGPQTVTFHYVKSARHHVIHTDGAYASVTPSGLVTVSLFNELFPIHTETKHSLIDATTIEGKPRAVKKEEGIVREIDVTSILNPETARKIGELLIAKANEAEKVAERAKKTQHQGGK
jgi:hypothetical protein